MKIVKHDGQGKRLKQTVIQITRNEAILLIARFANQLCKSEHPPLTTNILTENGEFVDIQIDFSEE